MAIGIPGSRGLFSMLQDGLKYTDKHCIKLTPAIVNQLSDFEHLANDLSKWQTSIAELVPDYPATIGPHDASGLGMGGVWLPTTDPSALTPILWRNRFPLDISTDLVSFANPTGTITNSDLELAGCIAHQDVLQQEVDCTERTVMPLGDNTPSVSWHLRGSTSSHGPATYLLQINSLHQRHFRYLSKSGWIAGSVNQMADDCSHLWHLSDSQLLSYFNLTYPQAKPWKLVHLRPAMHSALTLALQQQRPEPRSFLNEPERRTIIGKSGKISLKLSPGLTSTSRSSAKLPSYIFSKYSPHDYGEASLHPAATLFEVAKWRTTYEPLVRRSPWWTTLTLGTVKQGSSTHESTTSSKPIANQILLQIV